MQRPRLLWVRTADFAATDIPRGIAEDYFEVEVCSGAHAGAVVQQFSPQVVCFDFEQTNGKQLRAMRDFKREHPSMPVLMLTAQHSESLAVWAFRVRVWNFLVKPVRTSELRANFDVLARMVADRQGPARAPRCVGTLIPDDVADTSVLTAPLAPALREVEQHYASKLRQSAVACACGMTVCSFSRAFKAEFGLTFRQYLLRYRIGRACELLKQGIHSATDAGMAVGFEDASHFSRAFRRVLGVSPSKFLRGESLSETTATRWTILPAAALI
ncbi:MAG: response regulator transcription factor [Proteobacteria bacterium]|nr:response regulator transcription factor [Pseudomonadota bacterium]